MGYSISNHHDTTSTTVTYAEVGQLPRVQTPHGVLEPVRVQGTGVIEYRFVSGSYSSDTVVSQGFELEPEVRKARQRAPYFPAECRASRPQARRHTVQRTVISVEWDRAMRARWLR